MSNIYTNSWLILDKKQLIHNIKQFKRLIGDEVALIPVIKSNAYGHGIKEVSKICNQRPEVKKLAVASLDEAIFLQQQGITKPILTLSFFNLPSKIEKRLLKRIEFVIYDLNQAKTLNTLAKKYNLKIKIHLKIDTGTSRLGILPNETINFAKKLKQLANLQTYGIFTHFATAEEINQNFTLKQIKNFNDLINSLARQNINFKERHAACSAAILLQKSSHYDAVRLGLSLYGMYSLENHREELKKKYPWFNIKPVLTWKTKIIQIKKLPKGTSIGYGRTHSLKQVSRIAVLPVGYWDGYDRKLSNKAQVLINGVKCPVIGRVCMNLIMVNLKSVKNVKIGDEVVLLGRQKNSFITTEDLAEKAGTINYEITTRINPLLTRIIK